MWELFRGAVEPGRILTGPADFGSPVAVKRLFAVSKCAIVATWLKKPRSPYDLFPA